MGTLTVCHIGWKWQLKIGILHNFFLIADFFLLLFFPLFFNSKSVQSAKATNERTWNNEPLINGRENNSKKGIYCRQHFKGKNWTEIAQFPSHARLSNNKKNFLCIKIKIWNFICAHIKIIWSKLLMVYRVVCTRHLRTIISFLSLRVKSDYYYYYFLIILLWLITLTFFSSVKTII